MPVTITTASHAARRWKEKNVTTPARLFQGACNKEFEHSKQLFQSSFSETQLQSTHISASYNGLVNAVYYAYSRHHHLTIRPEDVWFAILCQLNFYINAHAEELRDLFVAHEGKKEVTVYAVGDIYSVDFGMLAQHMTGLMQDHIKDEGLRTWIMPAFSTTTDSDRSVAAVLMMGAMQKYFSYGTCLTCGIPSVTLLGERADWEMILSKLDKLGEFGDEPAIFAQLLRPVLRNFIATFDAGPKSNAAVVDFWSKIAARISVGSDDEFLSGWITAFCMWNEDGKMLHTHDDSGLTLDGGRTYYHQVDMLAIPTAFASVPVSVNDNGKMYDTKMVAGSVGIAATSSGQLLDLSQPSWMKVEEPAEKTGLDSLQPVTGWFLYEVGNQPPASSAW